MAGIVRRSAVAIMRLIKVDRMVEIMAQAPASGRPNRIKVFSF